MYVVKHLIMVGRYLGRSKIPIKHLTSYVNAPLPCKNTQKVNKQKIVGKNSRFVFTEFVKTCDELGYRFDICVFEDGAPILPSSVWSIQGTVIQNQQFQFGKPAILEH